MAARRLLILLLAVLATSTLAAALLGPRAPTQAPPSTTTTGEQAREPQARDRVGRLVAISVQAGGHRAETIRLHPGDQLELTVRSPVPGQVEVRRFGLLEDVGPDVPAHFSLLLHDLGRFAVRAAGSGRAVAVIVVSATGAGTRGPVPPGQARR